MDLNIILWIGGMLFSLGIFALKVGLGLGYGKVGAKGVSFTLAGYLALFIAIALLSERLIGILEPLLRKGPYFHTLTGAGLIAWGLFAIRGSHHPRRSTSEPGAIHRGSSLLLLIPCPVCITAMRREDRDRHQKGQRNQGAEGYGQAPERRRGTAGNGIPAQRREGHLCARIARYSRCLWWGRPRFSFIFWSSPCSRPSRFMPSP